METVRTPLFDRSSFLIVSETGDDFFFVDLSILTVSDCERVNFSESEFVKL
jgi:hypothetical protein